MLEVFNHLNPIIKENTYDNESLINEHAYHVFCKGEILLVITWLDILLYSWLSMKKDIQWCEFAILPEINPVLTIKNGYSSM